MKKIINLISLFLVTLLVTGCSSSSGTIICKSEVHGEEPIIVNYEEYVVKDNKVVEFYRYNTLEFSDEYLSKISLDEIMEVYKKEDALTVEKINKSTLKTTFKEPRNLYEDIESDNMLESIRASFEDNIFNIYTYTCEIK